MQLASASALVKCADQMRYTTHQFVHANAQLKRYAFQQRPGTLNLAIVNVQLWLSVTPGRDGTQSHAPVTVWVRLAHATVFRSGM